MEHGVSIRDICIKYNPQDMNIDERKLVKFGLIYDLIRRVHQYPVFNSSLEDVPVPPSKYVNLYKLCNGMHHFDDICCKIGITFKQLNDKIEKDPYINVISK